MSTRPAWNHVTAGAAIRSTEPPSSVASTHSAIAQAPTDPAMTGQWLWARRYFGPKKPAMIAPASGSPGISHNSHGSDIRILGLCGAGGHAAGGGERGQRLLGRRRRQRLGVQRRLLVGFAQVLPEAHV